MPEDENKKREREEDENPQASPSPSPGTIYNYPGVSSASPASTQAAVIGQALSQLQSFSFQKEPNPEIVKYQYDAIVKLSDNFKEENLRQIDYQENRDEIQHDIIATREGREFTITLIALGVVVCIMAVGVVFLSREQTVAGASLLSGGLGTVLGFLGGMGMSKKFPV